MMTKSKKFLLLMLTLVMFGTMQSYAQDDDPKATINNLTYTYNSSSKEAAVQKVDEEYTGAISVPESITIEGVEYKVTKVGDGAFYFSKVTSIK